MHRGRTGGVGLPPQPDAPGDLPQLRDEVLPLPDPQPVQVLLLTHPPEARGAPFLLLLAQVGPQVQPRQEVGRVVGEAGMHRPSGLTGLDRCLARILDRQRGGDDDDLAQRAEAVGLQHHPTQPWVDRKCREPAAQFGDPRRAVLGGFQRSEFLEQRHTVGDRAPVRGIEEREVGDLAQPQRGHRQDHRGEVGAQDLRLGELRAPEVVGLVVEPDTDARRHPAAPPGPLVGRGLRDRLDREALDLAAHAVAGDARRSGIDDVPDAGDRQRGLGDVRRQDHPAARVRGEDPVLLGDREPGVQGKDLHIRRPGPGRERRTQRVRRIADLPFAGQEDQDIPAPLAHQLAHGLADRAGLIQVLVPPLRPRCH